MSDLLVTPELVKAAVTDLTAIGSTLDAAHLEAAGPTVTVLPAAADEVSASIADLFSQQAAEYQKLATQAAAFHQSFVERMNASADAYAGAEAANVALLQQPLRAIADSLTNAVYGLLIAFEPIILSSPFASVFFDALFLLWIVAGLLLLPAGLAALASGGI